MSFIFCVLAKLPLSHVTLNFPELISDEILIEENTLGLPAHQIHLLQTKTLKTLIVRDSK